MVTSGTSTVIGCLPPGEPCAPNVESCDGTAAVGCVGFPQRLECSTLESHCAISDGEAMCVANASDCDRTSPDRCSGDALRICVNGRYDSNPCSSIGLSTCQATSFGSHTAERPLTAR